jgi:signal transduction histidine kinase
MPAIGSITAILGRSRSPHRTPQRRHLERVRRFDAATDEFVGLVSQELRAPLTSVRGYLDLVLDGGAGLTPEQEHVLGVASRSCERLHRLVDDLLLIAHAGAGRLALDWDRVDLAELAREVLDAHRDEAAAKSVELALVRHGHAPLLADRARVRQLLDAIVTSSLLAIPGSGLSVGVARAIAEAHGGSLDVREVGDSTTVTATVPTFIAEHAGLEQEAA